MSKGPASQTANIDSLLDAPRTPYNRSELSECVIGCLREYAAHEGWDRATLHRFVRESLTLARENGCTPDGDGMTVFVRARRAGRGMLRAHRAARHAAFAQLVGKGLI